MSLDEEPTDEQRLDVEVPALLDGVRVDRALAMLLGISRTAAATLVESGAVQVDGRVVRRRADALAEGQRLEAEVASLAVPAAALAPEPDVALSVVLEDPDFVVVDKPAGVVVHPGAGHATGTLVAGLLARYPELADLAERTGEDPRRPGIVHRLDLGTSGLLVVARTPRAEASLRAQLAAHEVERRYTGLAEGSTEDRGLIDAPLGRSLRTPTKMAVRPGGRESRTAYVATRRFVEPTRTLLDLRLETGRTHQIRVHLAAIGHPIVNDPRYGRARERRLVEGRCFLHARELAFAHPVSGETVRVTSPLPEDLAELLEASRELA